MKFVFFFMIFLQVGCSSVGGLVANTLAGALGNMIDRRIEDKLGNDAELSDEKLEPKLKKEKDNECKDCEADKR
jgi:hypothetical protein|tara:strand:- start:773 stop:994 length:222 start_codon:yes stop_codon:yes gene_type:complete